jgi:DNA invertase Pin-like site-specific DNA recombinase
MPSIIYARVSTKCQSTERQVEELRAVAEKAGWDIADVKIDHGISGSKGRQQRPALDETLKAITQRKADRVMVWSVDRLGRSLQDLISTLNDIKAAGADLYIHQQAIDTSTPAGKALFGMLGIFAEFEREIIRERVVSGLERAKANGVRLGRKPVAPITVKQIHELRAKGLTQTAISKKVGVSQAKVSQILKGV